ncbi:MAG: Vitamin B12-binding protein precursor [Firmicutes bacterium ADurb.Bin456]|nr:MAG: Vitamin B12-binding protein precursor [Firmicutes bacterium ADurb.Bin456]
MNLEKGRVFTGGVITPCVLLLFFLTILIPGCGKVSPGGGSSSGSGFPFTLKDDLGRQVTLNQAPARIVSLVPAQTEILFALGLGDQVVGVTEFCDYPAGALTKPKVGGFATPNAELVVAAQPDLILAGVIQKDFIRQFEEAGLKVIALESPDLPQTLEKIRLVGRLTGVAEVAENLVDEMQRRVNSVTARVGGLTEAEKPTVFFEVWPEPLTTGGARSYLNSLIIAAGGRNIAGDVDKDWFTYSPEMVLAKNPQVIIFCHHGESTQTVEQLKAREGWGDVAAIKEDRIGYIGDQNLVVRAGPRVVEGLEQIARCLHPGLFAD